MHVALHRHSLSLTSSLLSYPEKAVIQVGKVHIHHALVVIAAHFAGEAFELHRRVVQVDRLSAFLLPLADLLDDEREPGRARQQDVLGVHAIEKRKRRRPDGRRVLRIAASGRAMLCVRNKLRKPNLA